MKSLTHDDLLQALKKEVNNCGSVKNFAKKYNFSQVYVYELLKGIRLFGPRIMEVLGFEKVIVRKGK